MTKSTQQTNNSLPPSTHYHRFITPYGPKRKVSITFTGDGKTKQSFKDECDINKIMARFQQTGLLDFVNNNQGQYLDCTGVDYQDAQLLIANANSMFQALPSQVRAFFENDPAQFVEFASNPENLPQMQEMGLTSNDYKPSPPPTNQAPPAQPIPAPAAPGAVNTPPAPSAPGT